MGNANKITQDEQAQLKSLIDSEQRSLSQLGLVTYEIERLTRQKNDLLDNIKSLESLKIKAQETFQQKYGNDVSINLDTGEITPTK
mgnify:CR=1 FL=1